MKRRSRNSDRAPQHRIRQRAWLVREAFWNQNLTKYPAAMAVSVRWPVAVKVSKPDSGGALRLRCRACPGDEYTTELPAPLTVSE
jgi:hypothetical protein